VRDFSRLPNLYSDGTSGSNVNETESLSPNFETPQIQEFLLQSLLQSSDFCIPVQKFWKSSAQRHRNSTGVANDQLCHRSTTFEWFFSWVFFESFRIAIALCIVSSARVTVSKFSMTLVYMHWQQDIKLVRTRYS